MQKGTPKRKKKKKKKDDNKLILIIVFFMFLGFLLLWYLPTSQSSITSYCGNHVCEPARGENWQTCPVDCSFRYGASYGSAEEDVADGGDDEEIDIYDLRIQCAGWQEFEDECVANGGLWFWEHDWVGCYGSDGGWMEDAGVTDVCTEAVESLPWIEEGEGGYSCCYNEWNFECALMGV